MVFRYKREMDLEQEKALVQKSQEDIKAFGELYDEYYARIFNYVLRRTASIESAQDITSEVFFKALKNIKRFRWRGIPFSSWLYRIAANEIANYFRNHRHVQYDLEVVFNSSNMANPSAETEILEAEAELKRNEEFLVLHENIPRLSVKYQEVLTLRFFENKPLKEIGELGVIIYHNSAGNRTLTVNMEARELTLAEINQLGNLELSESDKQKAIDIARADTEIDELLTQGTSISKVIKEYIPYFGMLDSEIIMDGVVARIPKNGAIVLLEQGDEHWIAHIDLAEEKVKRVEKLTE